jgi:hypothetical protein
MSVLKKGPALRNQLNGLRRFALLSKSKEFFKDKEGIEFTKNFMKVETGADFIGIFSKKEMSLDDFHKYLDKAVQTGHITLEVAFDLLGGAIQKLKV